MRSALVALLAIALLTAGCSSEVPQGPLPEPSSAPSEPAEPFKPRWKVSDPIIGRLFGLYSDEDAARVWKRAVSLLQEWHLNPGLMEARRYLPSELYPVAKFMSPVAGKRWRKDVRKAIRGIELGVDHYDHRAASYVYALVVWNMRAPKYAAWREPIVTAPKLTGAIYPWQKGLRVDAVVTAKLHVERGFKDGVMPYSTLVRMYYIKVKGKWLIEIYSGRWTLGKEKIPGESESERPKTKRSQDADESTSGTATSVG